MVSRAQTRRLTPPSREGSQVGDHRDTRAIISDALYWLCFRVESFYKRLWEAARLIPNSRLALSRNLQGRSSPVGLPATAEDEWALLAAAASVPAEQNPTTAPIRSPGDTAQCKCGSTRLGAVRTRVRARDLLLLAVWLWAGYVNSLSLNFLIAKRRIKILQVALRV